VPTNIHWRKDNLFNKWCQENWISTCRRLKLGPYLSPCAKINPKCIKDLNVKFEKLKVLQETIDKIVQNTDRGNDFLDSIQIAQEVIARICK
jgi:hypothetical protein